MSDSESSSDSEDSDYENSEDSDSDIEDNPPDTTRPKRTLKEPSEYLPRTGWTLTEKRQLFNALADYGSSNLEILSNHIPTKSFQDIKDFVGNYQRFARGKIREDKHFDCKSTDCKASKYTKSNRVAPIDAWLEYILKTMSNGTHKCMLFSRALKYIALFEPRIGLTNVELKKCYEVLSTCLEGQSPRYLNRESSAFFVDNLQKLAKNIRYHNHNDEEVFLSGPKKLAGVKCYGSKKKKTNEDPININVNDKSMNPLNVPEKLLFM